MNEAQLTSYIKEILKSKNVKEGTCGYGIDGEIGDEPAGPHLQKKIKEALSPETAAKADSIKKAMIGKNRDKLFRKYGKDAEKVAHGRAVNQAKKSSEKEESVNETLSPSDFPKNFFYGDKIYVFDRIAGGDRAVYYNPKYKGDKLVFGSKKEMEDYLGDYTAPKGGTQSSHFGTNEAKSINEDENEIITFFHPSEENFSSRSRDYKVKTLQPWIFPSSGRKNRAQNATEDTVMSVYDENEALQHQEKYGKPDEKVIKAFKYIDNAMWGLKRETPARAYDEYSWYRFGNGSASDIGYVYSPENGFEFYLNLPREIRHSEEYSWVKDEDIEMFNNITNGVQKLADEVGSMGFRTSINSTPEGYKGSLSENKEKPKYKKGDKVTSKKHKIKDGVVRKVKETDRGYEYEIVWNDGNNVVQFAQSSLDEVYSEKQRRWACAQDDPKFDEMCKDTAISKKKKMEEEVTDKEEKKLKKISKELNKASKMHKGQADRISKIVKETGMNKAKKNMDMYKDKNRLEELIKAALMGPISEKKQRPDYPDIDGDGDTEEPMAKAAKDKEKAEANESFDSLAKKLDKQKGIDKEEAAKIAGSIAQKKLKGAGKGPTAKQKARMAERILKELRKSK